MGAPIASLRDDFADASIAAAWQTIVAGSATAAEISGQARLTLPSSTAGTHSAYFRTASTYDLTGDQWYINIQTMVATGVAATMTFDVFLDGSNVLRWTQASGTLKAQTIVAGVVTDQYSVAWNASTHKYLRIRHGGANVAFDTSTDGITWTNRAIPAAPFAVTDLTIQFGASCGNVASPGSLRLDDVNLILPALTTTWRWTQGVWPLSNRYKVVTLACDVAGTAQGYVVTADGVDVSGDPSGNVAYWSGPADGGRELTSQASDAAAKAMAVDIPVDGRFDLPTIIEARCIRVYHRSIDGSAYTMRELYPRRLVQSDDMEAESVRAINIAASAVTVDKLDAVLTITGKQIQTAYNGARAMLSGDANGGFIGYGAADTYDTVTGIGTYQALWRSSNGKLYAGGGAVTLDDGGITAIVTAPSYVASSAYKFTKADGTLLSDLYAQSDSGTHAISLDAESVAAEDSTTFITAHAPATFQARVQIAAYAVAPTTQTSITLTSDSNATNPSQIVFVATDRHLFQGSPVTIEDGLNVGTVTPTAGAGEIKTQGSVAIATTISTVTRLVVKGGGTGSGTFGVVVQDSGAGNTFYVRDDGFVFVKTSVNIGANKVVGARITGYTNPMTGTANRATSYATGTITLIQLAERVKALEDDMLTHGLIGA